MDTDSMTRAGRKAERWSWWLLAMGLLTAPLGARAGDCWVPQTWSDWIRVSCRFSTHMLVGDVLTLPADSAGTAPACYTMRPTRVFRGAVPQSETFTFCVMGPAKRDSLAGPDDRPPRVGERWLVFGSSRMPESYVVLPDGAALALMAYRVDVDSVRAPSRPAMASSALLDTVAAVVSRYVLTEADSIRAGWK